MPKGLELNFEHSVYYGTVQPPAIRDIIESLIGMERIAGTYLSAAYSSLLGAEVVTVETHVKGFEDGSFIQQFLFKLIFESEEQMNAAAAKIRGTVVDVVKSSYDKIPGENNVYKGAAVAGVVAALIAVGATYAITANNKKADTAPAVSINLENSPVIIIGAEAYQMSTEAFLSTIQGVAASDKKKLAENAVRIIAPAKREENSALHIGGLDMPALDAEIVKQTPTKFKMDPEEYTEEYNDVDLQIRATDRDSKSSGWSAVIPNIVDTRVKLKLDDDIDPNNLANHQSIRANVVVYYRYIAARKKHAPSLIEVVSTVKD